jgi:hypothetical protein
MFKANNNRSTATGTTPATVSSSALSGLLTITLLLLGGLTLLTSGAITG